MKVLFADGSAVKRNRRPEDCGSITGFYERPWRTLRWRPSSVSMRGEKIRDLCLYGLSQ